MANSRNKVDNLLNISGPKVPRYIHTSPTAVHLTSVRHGHLGVCLCMPVLANESVSFDSNVFARADTSARVPLDDIFTDIYYFYVPYRFLDEDFVKVLGDKHPLDDTEYAFPQIKITDILGKLDPSCLLFDLGWSFVQPEEAGEGETQVYWQDHINAYFLMAYWKIYNDFFRDENLDPFVDIDQLKDITMSYANLLETDLDEIPDSTYIRRLFFAARANKLTDIYSRSLISPQYGDAHKIPAASLAPVVTGGVHDVVNADLQWKTKAGAALASGDYTFDLYSAGTSGNATLLRSSSGEGDASSVVPSNLWTSLQQNMGTIQELSVAMCLQAMDFARATHGHRYIETLEALWGSSMPDYLVGRAEYLGGITTTLNNIPILSTEAASLGAMAGNSASLFNDGGFTKTFPEPGVVIGVYTNRVYHKSAQGKAHYLNYKTLIDLPNIYVADFGPMPLMQTEQANIGDDTNGNAAKVFSFSKSFIHERMVESCVGGIFNPNTGVGEYNFDEFRQLWSYVDMYEYSSLDVTNHGLPTFNSEWLKEDSVNVARTMTGRLIPGAADTDGNKRSPQYMFGFYQHCKRTNFLPPEPDPLWYVRRL